MISRLKSLPFSFVALALTLVIAHTAIRTHENPTKPAELQKATETEQEQELRKKTVSLLNEIAGAAWGLKLPENRIFVMASAAELLWPFDEKRARTIYWDALNSINSMSPQVRSSGESLSKAERDKAIESYISVYRQRQKILRQVARRDSQLALEMLRASRQVAPRPSGPDFSLPDDQQLEQEIATEIAAHDPAQALQLARQNLAKGLKLELLNLLYQLSEKDPEKALQLAGDIIAKLRTINIATDFRASLIATYLLEHSRPPDLSSSTSAGTTKFFSLNDEQRRELVDLLTNAALSVSSSGHLLSNVSALMPEVQLYFPERQAALQRKLAAVNATLTNRQREDNSFNDLILNSRAEEIIRRAASADDERRPELYREAALIAAMRGTSDSFRDVVSAEVNDKDEQRKILEFLDAEEISVAAGRKQLDRLKKLLPRIQRKEERARAMAEAAVLLKEQGEDAEAVSLLDEAANLIKTDLKSETRTNALLTLLAAYALVDPPKAFVLAERTVDQSNQQISMLMLIDKVVKSGAVKKSELLLENGGIMPLDFMLLKHGKGVTALAKADFNRTRALADRFERNELRVMARLLIVKGILGPDISQRPRMVLISP